MNDANTSQAQKKGNILMLIGLAIMVLLSLTQLIPSLRWAGVSVLFGIAFFFIVEAVKKTPSNQSGLRFKSFFSDIKKPGVLLLMLLPIVSALLTLFIGDLIFKGGFSTHVMNRTDSMLSVDKIFLLILQVPVLALGEEIAWRGFFLGKSMERFPFWLCAVVSSVLFAMGHVSEGNIWLVLYDVGLIFVDSIIYSVIYKKNGNCLISTVAHIFCNAVGLAAFLLTR